MSTYPPADTTTQWFDAKFGWDVIKPNVMVWHSTEGFTWPGYDGGAKAPHITAKPDFAAKKLRYRQHFANEHSSRALQNLPGGVTTNTNNAFQIELVGTCDDAYKVSWGTKKAGVDYIHWPTAPDWALKELALLVKYLNTKFGLPMRTTVTWAAYKSPGGLTKNVRLSGAAFQSYTGHLGHQHVPENTHGDPGSLQMQRILDYAKGTAVTNPTPPTAPTAPVTTTPKATTVTLSVYPKVVSTQQRHTLTAKVTSGAAGTVKFQWSTDGGTTWHDLVFGGATPVTVSGGKAEKPNEPGIGSDHTYRAIFTPADAKAWKGSTSAPLLAPVVDLLALRDRVTKLENL